MARRKSDPKQQPDNAPDKPPARVMRRRRRGPADGRQRSEAGAAQQRPPQGAERNPDYGAAPPPAGSVRLMSRAPRPAEPPPKNPNVFSYTYTIWKSS